MKTNTRKRLRAIVFERDHFKCVQCGETENLTLDHIISQLDGGTDDLSNLQTLCAPCNQRKGASSKVTFKQRIKFLWRSYERIMSLKDMLKKDIETKMLVYVKQQSFNDRLDKVSKAFTEVDQSKRTTDIRLVGIENDISLLKKEKKQLDNFLYMLVIYLDIHYVPERENQVAHFTKGNNQTKYEG